MSEASRVLREATGLARQNPGQALALLDEAMAAQPGGQSRARLAKHGGVISDNTGQLKRALSYYQAASKDDPEDAHVFFAIGDVAIRLGMQTDARSAYARCIELARAGGDTELAKQVEQALSSLKG